MFSVIVTSSLLINGQTVIDRQPPVRQATADQCAESVRSVLTQPQRDGVRVTAHCVGGV